MHRNPMAQPRLTPLVLQLPRQYEALDSRHSLPLFDLGTEAVYARVELFERHEQGRVEGAKEVAEIILDVQGFQRLWSVVLPKTGTGEYTRKNFQDYGETRAFMRTNNRPWPKGTVDWPSRGRLAFPCHTLRARGNDRHVEYKRWPRSPRDGDCKGIIAQYWAHTTPGWHTNFQLGVRRRKADRLVLQSTHRVIRHHLQRGGVPDPNEGQALLVRFGQAIVHRTCPHHRSQAVIAIKQRKGGALLHDLEARGGIDATGL